MPERVCLNPDCSRRYVVEDVKKDDGFCSFDCWEKIHCKEPQVETFEHLSVA